ncbi:septum site-determining protein MinC [Candidatus Blochmanniella vafra str. BVAF]|uniref:Probable septum site-determining protein MinC n=1 Tax=Blochmanniella vafra (strain BVAF) TaxID=859654 RepID=E8Q705_BLOVB|nr:septum site-determining protein MinC [Candidatus Blochmannia vafer]ADV33829.1 septum site-determining protein MinC [Candidatus Blochmannia vafer str. BVAF]
MSKVISIDLQGSNFTLLVMHAHTTCMPKIRLALIRKIKESPNFFTTNTPIIINVANINQSSDWLKLYQTVSEVGLLIMGVCCCYNNQLKKTITKSRIPILTKGTNIINYNKNYNSKIVEYHNYSVLTFKTQIIYTPIRSGQQIYARNRDLVVIANVSSGAEIISDGNIHIYGAMRGRVLAGASGHEESQIFCSNLSPELVSIGGHYWLIDQIPQEFLGKSARFYLKNNALVIQHIV